VRSWQLLRANHLGRVSIAACNATAPTTFGEPASSRRRVGQTTSPSSTSSTAPPPARNGSPSTKSCEAYEHSCSKGCIHLVAAHVTKSPSRGGDVRRELGAVDSTGSPGHGGVDDLVDRRQPSCDVRTPVTVSRRAWGPVSSFATSPAVKVRPIGTRRSGTWLRETTAGDWRDVDNRGDDNVVGTQTKR